MKTHSLVGASLVAALVVLTGCNEGIKFQKKAPAVGQKVQEKQQMDMNMSMTVDLSAMGKPAETTSMSKVETTVKTAEVLAASGEAATKVKVTYSEKTDLEKKGEKEKSKASPLVGKTYIVERKDGELVVTDVEGKPVPESEARLVKKDNKSVGEPDKVAAAMPERPIKVGEEVPELAKAIEAALTKDQSDKAPKPELSGVKVKLREDKGDYALFDVAVTFSQAEGPMTVKMELTGTMGVRKSDSQPTELTLKGPLSIATDAPADGKPQMMKIDGKGDMAMTVSATYL